MSDIKYNDYGLCDHCDEQHRDSLLYIRKSMYVHKHMLDASRRAITESIEEMAIVIAAIDDIIKPEVHNEQV